MVRTFKSPRSLRPSLRSSTPSKPVVSRTSAPSSPGFRLTRRQPVNPRRRLPRFSLPTDSKSSKSISTMDDTTYCSEFSEDMSMLSNDTREEILEIYPVNPVFKVQKDRRSVSARPTVLPSITRPSKIISTTTRGASHLTDQPVMVEALLKEVKRSLPQVAMDARRKCGAVFAQLRFSEGEAHVDYVRLPLTQKGLDVTSPAPKLTRSRPFVGLHNCVSSTAA